MTKKILHRLKLIKKYVTAKYYDINIQVPIKNEIYFCFLGEFGYELISWIPYLIFLKKTTGIRMNTVSRPGSRIFYYFSDKHIESKPNEITGMWGDKENYKKISERFGIKKIVYPSNDYMKRQRIIINGYELTTKNIHAKIEEKNYIKPDLSNINNVLPFDFKKFIIINNKYDKFRDNKFTKGWKVSPNFFDRKSLLDLKILLLKNGYSVVYNRFIEDTAIDEGGKLDDGDIFHDKNCYDMRNFYLTNPDSFIQNEIQISAYNKADFVIAVQGGNVYLPAICKKNVLMLMREGNYLDYTELARLFQTKIDVFYEPEHLLLWLKNFLK